MGKSNIQCPICNLFVTNYQNYGNDNYYYNCFRCGEFRITLEAKEDINSFVDGLTQRNIVSSWIREHPGLIIKQATLANLKNISIPSVEEKSIKLLLYLSKLYPIAGQEIDDIISKVGQQLTYNRKIKEEGITPANERESMRFLPIQSIAWAQNQSEVGYLLLEYLGKHKGFIISEPKWKISPKGWEYIESIKKINPLSNICFIAMKFEDRLMDFSDKWMEPAIICSGYKPVRINKVQHNNLIDDEIIANIRKSKFIVADLTGNSYGVYFEAGFARGLGLETIYLCEKKYFDEQGAHFDINHYPFILWEENEGEKLQSELQLRIEATFGKGNYINE